MGTEWTYGTCAQKDTLTFTNMGDALFNDGPAYGPPDML